MRFHAQRRPLGGTGAPLHGCRRSRGGRSCSQVSCGLDRPRCHIRHVATGRWHFRVGLHASSWPVKQARGCCVGRVAATTGSGRALQWGGRYRCAWEPARSRAPAPCSYHGAAGLCNWLLGDRLLRRLLWRRLPALRLGRRGAPVRQGPQAAVQSGKEGDAIVTADRRLPGTLHGACERELPARGARTLQPWDGR